MTEDAAQALGGAEGGAPEAAPQQSSNDGNWLGSVNDDTKAFLDTKGWLSEDPVETLGRAVESYRNVEKMVGGRVKIPESGDEDGWNDLYNRLGRPESPDAYEFKNLPEDQDENLVNWFKETAHSVGLNPIQAETFLNRWNELNEIAYTESQADFDAQVEQDIEALRREWGPSYDENIQAGKRAVQAAGLEAEDLDRIETALGSAKMLKLFSFYGKGLAEDSFVDTKESAGSARAAEQLEQLKNDPSFMARYMSGDQKALQTMSNLMSQAG